MRRMGERMARKGHWRGVGRTGGLLFAVLMGGGWIGHLDAQVSRADAPSRSGLDRPAILGQDAADVSAGSSEGALFLLIPVGARGVGLGRAVTALEGPEGAFWNPAGLARHEGRSFLLYKGDDLIAESTAVSFLMGSSEYGTLGLAYQLLDFGDQQQTGPGGEVLGTLSFRNHLGVLSAATTFADDVSLGVNLKLVQLRESCRGQCTTSGVTATTFAVDVGFQAAPFESTPLRVAAMVAHLGPRLQVVNAEQADPLPSRIRLSAAYEILDRWREDDEVRAWTIVEVEDRWADVGDQPSVYLGAEFSIGSEETVSARAGYVFGDLSQNDGPAVGFGLSLDRFELALGKSLAASPLAGNAEPVHISFGLRF